VDGNDFDGTRRAALSLLATALGGIMLQRPFSVAKAGRKHKHKNRTKLAPPGCTISPAGDDCVRICCESNESCTLICNGAQGVTSQLSADATSPRL
jgi:hypothetical protein